MKARTCADSRSQRPYISKGESISPTVSTEALFITLVVYVHDEIYVATSDILREYLNADMDQFTTLQLEGDMVKLMVQVKP